MCSGDDRRLHPELSPPGAPARFVLAVIDVQGRGGIESVADVERVDVDDADGTAFVRHDGADIGSALRAKQIVGDAEPEAVAAEAARLGGGIERAGPVAGGARGAG